MSVRYRRRAGDLAADQELWAALDSGAGLTRILTDFYDRVYTDERLAPFFRFTTKERAIQKQYSFLREIITGEQCYFGNRPYNAHHWMVISDDLFDYREGLMEECLRRHGLEDRHVKKLRAVNEVFRKQIVKSAPKARKQNGVEIPLLGFDDVEVAGGTLCDGCQAAIDDGQKARYRVLTGETYCLACAGQRESASGEVAHP